MIDALKRVNAGPLPQRQRRADLARDHVGVPRPRDADARRLPRPGRHLQRARGARLLRLVDRQAAVRQRRRGLPRDQRRRRRLRHRPGRELERRRGHALARPVPDDAADDRRRDQPLRPPQPAAKDRLARRHRRGLRPSAGARPVPRLAQPPPARRRAPAGREQRRRRAPGRARRLAGGAGERARGERVRPFHRRPGDPGRRPQPHPLRRRRPSRRASGAEGVGARLHEPGGLGREPARARCTTCSSRSRRTASR